MKRTDSLPSNASPVVTGRAGGSWTRRLVVGLSLSVGFLVGCPPQTGDLAVGTISGVAIKGLVNGGSVTAFSVDEAGRTGDELGKTTTAEDGTFKVEVGAHAGPVLVCAAGGTYTEEATGGLVQLGAELCALVEDHKLGRDTPGVQLTPWTTLHVALTGCFLGARRDTTLVGATVHAAGRLNDFLSAGQSGFDFRTTAVASTAAPAAGLNLEVWHGILLAGLSESAKGYAVASGLDPGVRVTASTLTDALRQDIDDGACTFDGLATAGLVSQGTIPLSADSLRGAPQGLATSIVRFLEGPQNLSGVPPANVTDLVQRLISHSSEIFGDGGVVGDIDAPVVTFVSPAGAEPISVSGLVSVEILATDASEIASLVFTSPAQTTFTAATKTCATPTSCTLSGSLNTSLDPVLEGPLVITARATDASGNSIDATLNVVVNNSIPVINVTAPSDVDVDGVVTVSASATDGDGIQSLDVEIPGFAAGTLIDIEPSTGLLTVSWDTTRSPEGAVELVFRAVDAAGNPAELRQSFNVDNVETSSISGFVDVGSPVVGAQLQALDWSGRIRGAIIATATSAADGSFTLALDDVDRASVLVVCTGGSFVDVATGLTVSFDAGQELTLPVGRLDAGEPRQANINTWTTLAAARARHTPVVADDAFAISENLLLLSQHLRRPTGVFDVSVVRGADLTTETTTTASERAVLALSQAGLSRMAAELSLAAVTAVGTVTLPELVRVLAQDLETDPLLDGRGPDGAAVVVGPDLFPLSASTTRFDLAASVDRFVTESPLEGVDVDRNGSSITRNDCLNGRVYEALAEDAREALYPLDQEAVPFDTSPPSIDLFFSDTNNGRVFGDVLSGTIVVVGDAVDDEGDVTSFLAVLEPDGLPLVDSDGRSTNDALRVLLGAEVAPNGAEAADACTAADAGDVAAAVADDDFVCVCALAIDEQSNVGQELLCFARVAPVVSIAQPPLNAIFNASTSVLVDATANGGFDVESCTATVTSAGQTNRTLPTAINGATCDVDASLVGLPDAAWTLTVAVVDIAGRSQQATRPFRVDATPPVVVVIDPSEDHSDQTPAFDVEGTVTATGDLASVTIRLSQGGQLKDSLIITTPPTATDFSDTLVDRNCGQNCDGEYVITVFGTDLAGNNSEAISRNVSSDSQSPSLAFLAATAQPQIVDYDFDQPTVATGALVCPPSGVCLDRRPMQIASTARRFTHSQVFTVNGAPTEPIVRWENLFNNSTDVPTVLATASDAHDVEVRFEAGTTCNSNPTRVARTNANGQFLLELLASNFSTALQGGGLQTQSGTQTLCLAVKAFDAAGNATSLQTRNFLWRTISPPPPLTINSTTFTPPVTWPGNLVDLITFDTDGTKLDDFARVPVNTVMALSHAFAFNPYPNAVRFSLSLTNASGGALVSTDLPRAVAQITTKEFWTGTSTSNRFPQSTSGGALPMVNPCVIDPIAISPSSGPTMAPTWQDARGDCGQTRLTATPPDTLTGVRGTLFRVSAVGNDANTRSSIGRTTVQSTSQSSPPITVITANGSRSVADFGIAANPVFYYSVDGQSRPVSQLFPDADGVLTLQPSTTMVAVVVGNKIATPGSTFTILDNSSATALTTSAGNAFALLPAANPTVFPAITATNVNYGVETGSLPTAQLWGNHVSGTNNSSNGSDSVCDAGECALGLKYIDVRGIRVDATNVRFTLATRINGNAGQWSAGRPNIAPASGVIRRLAPLSEVLVP